MKPTSFVAVLALTVSLFVLPERASAQDAVVALPSVELAQLHDEASHLDLTAPALLTTGGALGIIGGVALAIAGAPSGGISFGSLGTSGGSPANDVMIGSGLALAAIGALVMIPSAVWLGSVHRQQRSLNRRIRVLERLSWSVGADHAMLSYRGTF
jgi:hypothetical protein